MSAESTVVEKDGFRIVAGALPEFFPFVVVFTPSGTVAMNHRGDPYCTDVQEMIAIGVKRVDWLCDYRLIAPHQQEMVAQQSVEYIAKSFNISLDVAYGWKVVATMGMEFVSLLLSEQFAMSKNIYAHMLEEMPRVSLPGMSNRALCNAIIACC